MRYSEMYSGMYVIRTKTLQWAAKLSGVICLVKGVQEDGTLHIQMTEDCIPVGRVLAVDKKADDGCWHDISDLVMEANSAILPSADKFAFETSVESNYRNFVMPREFSAYSNEDAEGRVCFIGEKLKNGGVVFSKSAYFVVAVDEQGYAAVYQGYCEYCDTNTQRSIQLRVINLTSNWGFYSAEEIVKCCHSAYVEDCGLADSYREEIRETTITSSTESTVSNAISQMELESAV